MVGMEPSSSTKNICELLGTNISSDGFVKHYDEHLENNITNIPGIFTAGSISGPMSISDTIADARSAAIKIANYLLF